MRTAREYREKLYKMRKNVWIDGELVGRDDPRLEGAMNVMAFTFDLASDPQYDGLMTAPSHLSGEKINRFCNVHRSTDDLLKKQEMTYEYCVRTGGCIGRCMGIDATNANSIVTYEADQQFGTEYNKRFLNWLRKFQADDVVANCAQTDVKGNRPARPHEQVDPDLYLHVVEQKSDGIVLRGAKAHNSYAPVVDWILALPTRRLVEGEGEWAVSVAVPGDAEGLKQIVLPSGPRKRQHLKAPYERFGGAESLTIFDNVFVPWEHVFLNGEVDLAGRLALLFALYHRHSYTGCKPAFTEVNLGLAALLAEYNGIEREQHVRHKLAEYISVAELCYGAGIAAGVKGEKTASGTYIPDVRYCNASRRHAGVNVYHEYDMLVDIAGGLVATLPPEGEWYNPENKALLEKYIMRNPKISAENQHRAFRLVQDLTASSHGGLVAIAAVHGGGSPVMEEIALLGNYDLEKRKNYAKALAGIPTT